MPSRDELPELHRLTPERYVDQDMLWSGERLLAFRYLLTAIIVAALTPFIVRPRRESRT